LNSNPRPRAERASLAGVNPPSRSSKVPSGPPAALDASGANDFATLAPLLHQVFFIGDGVDSDVTLEGRSRLG
jgi:hypothetical protein